MALFEAGIGHSFGGMCLYNAVATFLNLHILVTIGSGDYVSDIIQNFAKNLHLKKHHGKKIQTGLEKNGKYVLMIIQVIKWQKKLMFLCY